ncbi:hypothetical protein [Enterococcus rotai]|uniref:hypothetical protein n=1 Tax=Enterococcus rotai TaxID=118060 RepID=UPI0032B56378
MESKTIDLINYHWSQWFGERLKVALARTKQYESKFSESEYEELVGRCGVFLVNGLKSYLSDFEGTFNLKELEKWFDQTFIHCEEEIQYFISDIKRKCNDL